MYIFWYLFAADSCLWHVYGFIVWLMWMPYITRYHFIFKRIKSYWIMVFVGMYIYVWHFLRIFLLYFMHVYSSTRIGGNNARRSLHTWLRTVVLRLFCLMPSFWFLKNLFHLPISHLDLSRINTHKSLGTGVSETQRSIRGIRNVAHFGGCSWKKCARNNVPSTPNLPLTVKNGGK